MERIGETHIGSTWREEDGCPMDHARMMRRIEELADCYSCLSVSYIGESILGRGIPILTLGTGEKGVLYVGAHHGMEWITSMLLLRFVKDCCDLYQRNGKLMHISVPYLLSTRTLYLVPMLNPDGVEYQIHGVPKDHILYDRVLAMNGGSEDFSHWQANARGVDLNHNYNSGFVDYKRLEMEQGILSGAPTRYSGEMPESEPEVGHLCNLIRYHEELKLVLSLHTQGEEIYYRSGDKTLPRSASIARSLGAISGYKPSKAEGAAAYGGLTDWCVGEQDLLAFTIECGKGENPLPIRDSFSIYARIRDLLFCAPTMI